MKKLILVYYVNCVMKRYKYIDYAKIDYIHLRNQKKKI
jgi:hypothetical protein